MMKEAVKSRLERLGLDPSRSMGQNFLKDGNIAKRIVQSANIKSSDTVLEIGPGLGILTDIIVEEANKTILIEKDQALIGYLEGRYGDKNTEILKRDVLEKELPDFDKVVSNLPFNISSPITFKLLKKNFDLGILTYQKQYAERMVAKTGESEYSRLSVMVSTMADVKRLFDISKNSFYPPPKVNSSVVRLTPSEPDFKLKYEESFAEVVKELFNYRRKQIKNSIETGLDIEDENIPFGNKRVGNLPPEKINEIVNYLVESDLLEKKS